MSRQIRTETTIASHRMKMRQKRRLRDAKGSWDMAVVAPKPWARVTPRAVRYV